MKRLWSLAGLLAFWLGWPVIRLYLALGERTRVLVVVDNHVLVVKPWLGTGKWILPGGGLHRHEEPVAGVLRELREETGITLAPKQLRKLFRAYHHQYGLNFHYTCFTAKLDQRPPHHRQLLELIDIKWLPINELTPKNAAADLFAALDAWPPKKS